MQEKLKGRVRTKAILPKNAQTQLKVLMDAKSKELLETLGHLMGLEKTNHLQKNSPC
ncbi:MAG: hypothetical protein OXC92_08645 [Flavobacteriaceae bacterium]|nr:hypothetical protein [Flavobacteriaceae bacterium]MCY4217034.1 hypothetical protein [Flavobacteriaceae bacterium]MCY4253667.1 hypothetical protein [Flavobacteriaceae bacterium]